MRFFAVKRMFFCLVSLAVCTCNTVFADTVQGVFKFNKRAPSIALVYFSEGTGSNSNMGTIVDQKDKKFLEKMYVATNNSVLLFKNSDKINHNIFAHDKRSGAKFDVGLMKPGGSIGIKIDWDDKVVRCSCKIHPKMRTWIASISSEHYKIIEFERKKKEFSFEMNSFPENLSKMRVWLPRYASIELSLDKGESKDIKLIKKNKTYGMLTLMRK